MPLSSLKRELPKAGIKQLGEASRSAYELIRHERLPCREQVTSSAESRAVLLSSCKHISAPAGTKCLLASSVANHSWLLCEFSA